MLNMSMFHPKTAVQNIFAANWRGGLAMKHSLLKPCVPVVSFCCSSVLKAMSD